MHVHAPAVPGAMLVLHVAAPAPEDSQPFKHAIHNHNQIQSTQLKTETNKTINVRVQVVEVPPELYVLAEQALHKPPFKK